MLRPYKCHPEKEEAAASCHHPCLTTERRKLNAKAQRAPRNAENEGVDKYGDEQVRKREERFLAPWADRFAGANWNEDRRPTSLEMTDDGLR